MLRYLTLTCVIIILLISGCSPFTRITDPSMPLESPNYTILPPASGEWEFLRHKDWNITQLVFSKRPDSATHTTFAIVSEIIDINRASFSDPDEFLSYVEQKSKADTDPRRFTVVEEKYELKKDFGPYTALKYVLAKDNGASNLRGEDFLVMNIYGYTIVHPHPSVKNLLISVDYSERGKASEIDAKFKENAEKFISGLKLK